MVTFPPSPLFKGYETCKKYKMISKSESEPLSSHTFWSSYEYIIRYQSEAPCAH